jgi:hypothetical protein
MAFQDDFNPSILGKMRTGNWDNPYKSITETLPIINSKATLSEIPSKFEGVKVTGYSSTLYPIEDGELTETLYKVDYENGVVFFDIIHNSTSLTFTYEGIGAHFFPSSRIYTTQDDNGNIQTATDKFNEIDSNIAAQKSRVDQQINAVPQPNEILDIRVDKNGVVFPVAKDRIDAEQKKIEDTYKAKNGNTFNSLKERFDQIDDSIGDVDTLTTDSKEIVGAVNEINHNAQTYSSNAYNDAVNFAKQYGVGSQLSSYKITSDLNTCKSSGMFYVDASSDNNPTSHSGYLIVTAKDNNYVGQIFIDQNNGLIFSRTLYSSWSKWNQFQNSPITSSTGTVKLYISDTTKDVLQELLNLGTGLHTFYAASGCVNMPPSNISIRGIAHFTDPTRGYIWCTDYHNNIFTNYYDGAASGWRGWQQLASATQMDEINATLTNGWVNYATDNLARYWKDTLGNVHINGRIKGGSISDATSLFVLPAGYRPKDNYYQSVLGANIYIFSDGTVRIFTCSSNVQVCLDGIQFRAYN